MARSRDKPIMLTLTAGFAVALAMITGLAFAVPHGYPRGGGGGGVGFRGPSMGPSMGGGFRGPSMGGGFRGPSMGGFRGPSMSMPRGVPNAGGYRGQMYGPGTYRAPSYGTPSYRGPMGAGPYSQGGMTPYRTQTAPGVYQGTYGHAYPRAMPATPQRPYGPSQGVGTPGQNVPGMPGRGPAGQVPGLGPGRPGGTQTGPGMGPGRPGGTQTGPGMGPGRPGGTQAGPGMGPGRPGGTQAGPGMGPGRPGGKQTGPGMGPGRPGGTQAGPGMGPGRPGGTQAGPGMRPGGGGPGGPGRPSGQPYRGRGGPGYYGRGGHHYPPRYHGGNYYYNNYPNNPFWYGLWGFGLGFGLGAYYSPFWDYGFPYVYPSRTVVVEVPQYTYVPVPTYSYDNGYYLSQGQQTGLDDAIQDIRNAWVSGRQDLLLRHIDSNTDVQVFLNGQYSYSLPSSDYSQMVRDALGHVKTQSFTITGVEQRSDGAYVVSAKHSFYDLNDKFKSVDVSYTLARSDGRWVIVGVGSTQSVT